MADRIPTDGYTLSELPELPLPFRPTDIIESIRRREDAPDRYRNHNYTPDPDALPIATEEQIGVMQLADEDTAFNSYIVPKPAITPAQVLAWVVNMLGYQIAEGAGITLDYDPEAVTLTISAEAAPFGEFRVIGRFSTNGFGGMLEEGDIKGACTVYDPYTRTVDYMVQRPKIEHPDDGEYYNLMICAVDGDYGICCELQAFGWGTYIAIVPIVKDGDMVFADEWAANPMYTAGEDQTVQLIPVTDGQTLVNVCMIKAGEFVVISSSRSYSAGPQSYTVQYVKYSSPMTHTVETAVIDISSFGFEFIVESFTSGSQIAYNYDTGECAISLLVYTVVDTIPGRVSFKIDLATMAVSDVEADTVWAFGRMSTSGENVIAWGNSDVYSASCDISYDSIKVSASSYGKLIKMSPYTSRTPGASRNDTVYNGLVDTEVNAADLMAAHFVTLGYTPTFDSSYNIPFGAVSTFVQ